MNKRVKAIALSAIMIFGAQHLEAQKLKDKIGKIKNVKSFPIIISDDIESVEKTKELLKILDSFTDVYTCRIFSTFCNAK